MTAEEVAQFIYPQEWNDFVDTPQKDQAIENYRRQCYELDPLVNCPEEPDPVACLKRIIEQLRSRPTPGGT